MGHRPDRGDCRRLRSHLISQWEIRDQEGRVAPPQLVHLSHTRGRDPPTPPPPPPQYPPPVRDFPGFSTWPKEVRVRQISLGRGGLGGVDPSTVRSRPLCPRAREGGPLDKPLIPLRVWGSYDWEEISKVIFWSYSLSKGELHEQAHGEWIVIRVTLRPLHAVRLTGGHSQAGLPAGW